MLHRWRLLRAGVALGLCLATAASSGCQARTEKARVLARPVLLYEDQPGRVELGALRYQAGFVLGSADPRFGGLSGLQLDADGREMLALSDHGVVWRASLEHIDDRLVGVGDWRPTVLGRMAGDPAGRIDAEDLTAASGDLIVAVEGQEPLRRLAAGDLGAPARPVPGKGPLRDAAAAGNAGIEALTTLPDGALLALSEGVIEEPGQLAAWRIDGDRIERLRYLVSDGFAPTGADRLDDRIYVVERRFAMLDGGFAARVVELDAGAVAAGALLRGRELARLAWPAVSDNFEGIAVRRGSAGQTLIYLISDDNFLPLQRTLLLQFSLEPSALSAPAAPAGRSGSSAP